MEWLGLLLWILGWFAIWDNIGPEALVPVVMIWIGRGLAKRECTKPTGETESK
jgi:hypothetical protein